MKVEPIRTPLAGEHVVAVSPALTPHVGLDWRRRLNLYSGRTLSDTALQTEQAGRAGRLATRGRMVSAGVVGGLEVALEGEDGLDPVTGESVTTWYYRISPGAGLAASGEDVAVPRALRVAVRELPVYAPVAVLDGAEPDGPEAAPLPAALLSAEGPAVRRLDRPLGELIARGLELPRAGIVVLQPVVAELIGRFDPTDPCEEDPANYAFEDWQLVDGCRLVFYSWPVDWLLLPEPGPQWRNRLAYAIYDAERGIGPTRALPWEALGVPIGLVGFDAAWRPLFVDRFAVVRAGGKPRSRTALVARH